MSTTTNSINNKVGDTNPSVTNLFTVQNTDNTSATSHATSNVTVGGTSSGNPWYQLTVGTTANYAMGLDNADSQKFKLTFAATNATPTGTTPILAATTGGNVCIATNTPFATLTPNPTLTINPLSTSAYIVTLGGTITSKDTGNAGVGNQYGLVNKTIFAPPTTIITCAGKFSNPSHTIAAGTTMSTAAGMLFTPNVTVPATGILGTSTSALNGYASVRITSGTYSNAGTINGWFGVQVLSQGFGTQTAPVGQMAGILSQAANNFNAYSAVFTANNANTGSNNTGNAVNVIFNGTLTNVFPSATPPPGGNPALQLSSFFSNAGGNLQFGEIGNIRFSNLAGTTSFFSAARMMFTTFNAGAGGTMTNAAVLYLEPSANGNNATGTISSLYGLYISGGDVTQGSGGVVSNSYGAYISATTNINGTTSFIPPTYSGFFTSVAQYNLAVSGTQINQDLVAPTNRMVGYWNTVTFAPIMTPGSFTGGTVPNCYADYINPTFSSAIHSRNINNCYSINVTAAVNAGTNSIANYYGMWIDPGTVSAAGGSVTNTYGLYVNTPFSGGTATTGATNNYTAVFTTNGAVTTTPTLVGINTATPIYTLDVAGNIASDSVGSGFLVKEGSNAKMGTATLAAGTVLVANTSVTANSRIFLTINAPGGTVGSVFVKTRIAGTSFIIDSTSATDTSTVAYIIFEPA